MRWRATCFRSLARRPPIRRSDSSLILCLDTLRVLLEPGDSLSVTFAGKSTVTLQQVSGKWHWLWSEVEAPVKVALRPGESITVMMEARTVRIGHAEDGRYCFDEVPENAGLNMPPKGW